MTWKMFGVALDASDDPMSLELKWAAAMADAQGFAPACRDPYDAALAEPAFARRFAPVGKVDVPGWLTPRPNAADAEKIGLEAMQRFYDEKGFLALTERVRDFVRAKVLPDRPAMIGVDHSATGGVVMALSERLGADNLSVIVLDRHFDGLKPSERMAGAEAALSGGTMPFLDAGRDEYCCGSFWSYLLDSGAVLAENLAFIGVADYPREGMGERWSAYRDAYLAYERRGCRFLPLAAFDGGWRETLDAFLDASVAAQNVYVSLDVDVGSLAAVHAARYMDGPGLSRPALAEAGRAIARTMAKKGASLAGLDVVEFNMHFLGLETDEGLKDETLGAAAAFLDALLGSGSGTNEGSALP